MTDVAVAPGTTLVGLVELAQEINRPVWGMGRQPRHRPGGPQPVGQETLAGTSRAAQMRRKRPFGEEGWMASKTRV
jgi:hypothetical protein